MKKWEYNKATFLETVVLDSLNELGAEGWEVTAIKKFKSWEGYMYECFMKREIIIKK